MKLTQNELMMLRAKQKGRRAVRENFLDLKQKYLEPSDPKSDRRRRYERKRQYFEKKGIKDYEKL